MLGFGLYEDQVCECGFHESVTSDPSNLLIPQIQVCPVCAGAERYGRKLAAEDEAAQEKSAKAAPDAPRPTDGRRIALRHLSPTEAEIERERRKPKGGDVGGNSPRKSRT